jgi:hypothetical protein
MVWRPAACTRVRIQATQPARRPCCCASQPGTAALLQRCSAQQRMVGPQLPALLQLLLQVGQQAAISASASARWARPAGGRPGS